MVTVEALGVVLIGALLGVFTIFYPHVLMGFVSGWTLGMGFLMVLVDVHDL